MYAEPAWMRLGFNNPPDVDSGEGVGMIIIDDISPHPTLNHLVERVKHVVVADDLSVTCNDIASEGFNPNILSRGTHGLMTLLTLAHKPFISDGLYHTGLAPAGHFIVLSHGAFKEGEGERLKHGIEWIFENMKELNIGIVLSLGWHALDDTVLLRPTAQNSTIQALDSVVKREILVVCANGNSDIATILPPIDFLAVGGFNDNGRTDHKYRTPYPGEPFGFNGDGIFRPDIRAPRTRVKIPYCEGEFDPEKHSYYYGTSVASTLVAGVCMNLLSKFPSLNTLTLRNALTSFSEPLIGDSNPAPLLNAERTIKAILQGYKRDQNIENITMAKTDVVERAITLSSKIRNKECSREELWEYSEDQEPIIRKIAVYSLGIPLNQFERDLYWQCFHKESEDGVRTWYLYGLLQDADKDELAQWVPLANHSHWSIRWCVSEFLRKFPELPQLEKTHDLELLPFYAESVIK